MKKILSILVIVALLVLGYLWMNKSDAPERQNANSASKAEQAYQQAGGSELSIIKYDIPSQDPSN